MPGLCLLCYTSLQSHKSRGGEKLVCDLLNGNGAEKKLIRFVMQNYTKVRRTSIFIVYFRETGADVKEETEPPCAALRVVF